MPGQVHYLFVLPFLDWASEKIVSQGRDRVSNKMAKQREERNITDNETNKNF